MSETLNIFTLATVANMRKFEDLHPGRDGTDEDGNTFHVEGRRCFAYSPSTDEEYSASAGDYWKHGEDEPLTDSEGEPMFLAVSRTVYTDALTDELL